MPKKNRHKLIIDKVLLDRGYHLFLAHGKVIPFTLPHSMGEEEIEKLVNQTEKQFKKNRFFEVFMTIDPDKTPLSEDHTVLYSRED